MLDMEDKGFTHQRGNIVQIFALSQPNTTTSLASVLQSDPEISRVRGENEQKILETLFPEPTIWLQGDSVSGFCSRPRISFNWLLLKRIVSKVGNNSQRANRCAVTERVKSPKSFRVSAIRVTTLLKRGPKPEFSMFDS
jgi:hypothetical protein